MIGKLTETEIQALLAQQVVGRIACYNDDFLFLVPVSYAYDNDKIYVRSLEGTKVNLMRKNPRVCFEVDDIADMANWQSVIAWGEFEELQADERDKGLKILLQRHLPLSSSVTTHLGRTWPFSGDETDQISGIVFRINLSKKTGLFERTSSNGAMLD